MIPKARRWKNAEEEEEDDDDDDDDDVNQLSPCILYKGR